MTGKTISVGWGRWRVLTPLALLAAQLAAVGQGSTIFHQQFVTQNPNPLFPWDTQGQRVLGGPGFTAQWALDMNGNGQADFTFVSDGDSFNIIPSGNNSVLAYTYGPGGANAWTIPLPSLTPISANPGDNTWFQRIDTPFGPIGSGFVAYTSELSVGTFLGVESAYIGLQFMLDDGLHYGWARMGCPVNGLAGGWIYETAYEMQPGVPIFAGAVPEPSTFALFGLSAVAFWFVRRRR